MGSHQPSREASRLMMDAAVHGVGLDGMNRIMVEVDNLAWTAPPPPTQHPKNAVRSTATAQAVEAAHHLVESDGGTAWCKCGAQEPDWDYDTGRDTFSTHLIEETLKHLMSLGFIIP